MSNFSSTLSRVRSVKLSAFASTPPIEPSPNSNNKTNHPSTPRSRTISATTRSAVTNSFGETLRAMSKEAQNSEFADVFGSFFFNDKRCQNRAFFMAARLKQTLQSTLLAPGRRPATAPSPTPSISTPVSYHYTRSSPNTSYDALWEMMTHRLYTLNYILFVLQPMCDVRNRFLNQLESELAQIGDGQQVFRRGGMEVHFVVRYVLKRHWQRRARSRQAPLIQLYDRNNPPRYHYQEEEDLEDIVERAREVIEHCLESESKLGHAERDAMYVFHGMRMGLHGAFEPHIELDEDRELAIQLIRAVEENKQATKQAYVNPFEDADAIVTEEDDTVPSSNREVDSGFYDHFSLQSKATASS
ncbi:hypothetical protein BX666DRAFT_1858775 [Dichotomocladium elegans]|nr:hypothetical protein BX666DRAFT_1858775 [Dichotomocladium elegans]